MRFGVGLKALLIWSLVSCFAHATPKLDNLNISIDGIDYVAELEKSSLPDHMQISIGSDAEEKKFEIELYQGTVPEVPESWVAASYHNGEWQGLASIHGKLYELKGFGMSGTALAIVGKGPNVSMQASELKLTGEFDLSNMCAIPHVHNTMAKSALATIILNSEEGTTGTTAFAVGGIIHAVNVVLALDHFYLNQFGAGAVPRAMRILNNVDAIYRNSLGIALNNTAIQTFDAATPLPIAQPDITDAEILLDQVFKAQANVFGDNPRTLGALITYRDIQVPLIGNGVAGIAPLGATCVTQNGLDIAVSVNEDRATEGVASVILAHEMGHNFGANHDGPNPNPANAACPIATHIMSPVVVNGLNEFSNCSKTEIANHIALGNCYKEPIDIALARFGTAPPNNLAELQEVTRQIAVSNNGTVTITNIQVDGDIDNIALAKFTEVTVNGAACTLLAVGKSYSCSIAAIAAANQQIITEKVQAVGLGTFNFSASFNSSNVTQRIDIVTNNQFVTDSRTVNQAAAAPNAPTGLSATAQNTGNIELTWNDNSANEQNFIVQRSSNGGALATIANLPVNSTSFTDHYTNLTAGAEYTYQVVAMNSIGSAPSNTSTTTALERTVSINSSESSGNGGGGAFYLLIGLLLLARLAKRIN